MNAADLVIRISSEAKGALSGFSATEGRLAGLGKVAVGVAAAGIAAVGAAAVKVGIDSVQAAGDLQQSIGSIDAVFKGNAKTMQAWSQTAATDVGVTRNEFNELGTLIGSQLKNGGTAMDALAPKTRNLIQVGADLSAMYGGTTREAVEALSSALKGERDPIERYGVSLNQSRIDAEAAALGYKKVGASFSQQAQQAATLSLIMRQTKDAHGAFGRESDTLAHKQQVFAARLGDVKAKLGTALLPIATKVVGWLSDTALPVIDRITSAFSDVAGKSSGVGGAFGRISTAAAPIVSAFREIGPPLASFMGTVATTGRTIGTTLAPILQALAGTVIPAILGAFKAILPAWQEVQAAVGPLVAAIGARLMPVIRAAGPVVKTVFAGIGRVIGSVMRIVAAIIRTVTAIIRGDWKGAWNGIKAIVKATWNAIKTIVKVQIGNVKAVLAAAWPTIKAKATAAWDAVKRRTSDAWNAVKRVVTSGIGKVVTEAKKLPGRIVSALAGIASRVGSIGTNIIAGIVGGIRDAAWRLVAAAKDAVSNAINAAKDKLGINSPSRVFYDMGKMTALGLVNGLDDSARLVTTSARRLLEIPSAVSMASPAAPVAPARGTTVVVNVTGLMADSPARFARELEQALSRRAVAIGRTA